MGKYLLKQDFLDCEIHTKTTDGTDILITANTFDDYFAELMLRNGQGHLIKINPHFESENDTEKKSFVQISEQLISLTSPYEVIEKKQQNEIVEPLELKRKRGRQPKPKE